MPRRPKHDPNPVEDATAIEELTPAIEPTGDLAPDAPARPLSPRLALSVPGAVGGALLVCALAFGADLGADRGFDLDAVSARGQTEVTTDTGGDDIAAKGDEPAEDGDGDQVEKDPIDKPASETPDEPKAERPDKPKAEEQPDKPKVEKPDKPKAEKPDKPKAEKPDKPKAEKPKPKPEKPAMRLALSVHEGVILIDWTSCGVGGADYYKVVRSKDATVRWPAGDNDEVVAAVEVGGKTKAWDEHASSGKKLWYRVFCLRHTDDGYKVLAASPAKAIKAPVKPKPDPIPEPTAMWIEADVDGGVVVLHWEACGADAFSHYRILRKAGGEASVIAEVENHETTAYVDDDVEPGVTYHYLVQSKGHVGDDWFLLGTTEWVSVSIE